MNFQKYQGAGNDFIIVDSRYKQSTLSEEQISSLCDRHLGIGADGLIILKESDISDFQMQFFNSDGKEGSMCGNGGRCIAKFAFDNKIANSKMSFSAIDGLHSAEISDNIISLQMQDVTEIKEFDDGFFLDTGSPHFVSFVDNLETINTKETGRKIADEERFAPNRTNVNLVEFKNGSYNIVTFERGVEDLTLACGTGATASAIALFHSGKANSKHISITSKGGTLSVSFDKDDNSFFHNIKLIGPAKFVFQGEIII